MRTLLGCTLLLAGCASVTPAVPTTETERVLTSIGMPAGGTVLLESHQRGNITTTALPAPPDQVWRALHQVHAELELPINVLDTRTRIAGVQDARVARLAGRRPSWYLDCGAGLSGNHADQYEVSATLLTQIFEAGEGASEVRTRFEATAKDRAHSNNAVRCATTGRMERQIVEALRARIAAGPA